MFPATPITGIEAVQSGVLEQFKFDGLPGLRVVHVLRQAESLAHFAVEILSDIVKYTDTLFVRFDDLSERTEKASSLSKQVLAKLNLKLNKAENTTKRGGDDEEKVKNIELEKSLIVNEMLKKTQPAPDLSQFDALMDHEDSFSLCYSNPQWIENQYKREIFENYQDIVANKKAEAKRLREQLKEEKKLQQENRHSVQVDQKENEKLQFAFSIPPMVPEKMYIPPPKGMARHGIFSPHSEPKLFSKLVITFNDSIDFPLSSVQPKETSTSIAPPSSTELVVPIPPPVPVLSSQKEIPIAPPVPIILAKPKVETKPQRKIEQEEPRTFLDDIAQFNVKNLKPVKKDQSPAPKPKLEDRDPKTMTIGEILRDTFNQIRPWIALSDDEDESDSESTSTTF